MPLFLHHPPPLPFLLACAINPPPAIPLSSTEKQKEQQDPQIPPSTIPSGFTCIHHLGQPQPCQPALAIPRLLPLQQTPHVLLPKHLNLQFPPSVVNHSLPLSISSLSSIMMGRRLLSSPLLSRDSQRHPSLKPMASNNITIPDRKSVV